jgi:predicted oxidoreductase
MKKIQLGRSPLQVSTLSLGCMRMGRITQEVATEAVRAALDVGIDFFDHADIYGGGNSEVLFAKALAILGVKRDSLVLQSKCGITNGTFDFSREHILRSVDGILTRLRTDYLDILLLHRPDALMEPEEIASAFDELEAQGKVRHFGVSNQNPGQMDLLRSCVKQPLVANQLQISLAFTPLIDHGLNVNMADNPSLDRDNGTLNYCQLHRITVQAWSPLQHGFFKGVFLDHPDYPALNAKLLEIAGQQQVPVSAVAIAWLLRHPANMQPILGSMNPQHIRDMARAVDVTLTRPEWYGLYKAAGNRLP